MAIALQPKFPIPKEKKRKNSDDDVTEVGWCDGVLSDGRPFRAETWAFEGLTILTIVFSSLGLEHLDQNALDTLVQDEDLAAPTEGTPLDSKAMKWIDEGGYEFWSVSITVGCYEETYLRDSIPVFPYSKTGDPNSIFNPTPIKAAISKALKRWQQ